MQHANEDVEKMILGNKCDMEDKRMVSRERGDAVSRDVAWYRMVRYQFCLTELSIMFCVSLGKEFEQFRNGY